MFLVFFELIEYDYLTLGIHCWYSKKLTDGDVVDVVDDDVGKVYEEVHSKQSVAVGACSDVGSDELADGRVGDIVADAEDESFAENSVAGLEFVFLFVRDEVGEWIHYFLSDMSFDVLTSEAIDRWYYNKMHYYSLHIS